MNRKEFILEMLTNPQSPSSSLLEAASNNPELYELLKDQQALESRIIETINSVETPTDLQLRLNAAVRNETRAGIFAASPAANASSFLAVAASLLIAMGIAWGFLFDAARLSPAEGLLSAEVFSHIYEETATLTESDSVSMALVNQVMGAVGGQFLETEATLSMPFAFARPCLISQQGMVAHLVLQGQRGLVNVFVMSNSSSGRKFQIADDRFEGSYTPLASDGTALLVVGEKGESLDSIQALIAPNIDWVI